MTEADVADRTEAWVREQFSVNARDPRFARDVDLFENGYVDSVGLAELIGFLEEEFGVEISDEVLVSDEFGSIEGIAAAVCRLMPTSG
jgi:acyl carrier protein